MTIVNLSQEQSLIYVGVYLQTLVFSHFKSYFKTRAEILITNANDEDTNVTSNVIYQEVFQNLW
jgi:hypothetical protein